MPITASSCIRRSLENKRAYSCPSGLSTSRPFSGSHESQTTRLYFRTRPTAAQPLNEKLRTENCGWLVEKWRKISSVSETLFLPRQFKALRCHGRNMRSTDLENCRTCFRRRRWQLRPACWQAFIFENQTTRIVRQYTKTLPEMRTEK